jgi:hypothetical protein
MKPSELSTNEKHSNEKKIRWAEKDIKSLLSFLEKHKKVLKELVKKRGGSGNIKKELWNRASIKVSDNETRFLPEQCEFKWKNIKQACKVNLFTLIKYSTKKLLNQF